MAWTVPEENLDRLFAMATARFGLMEFHHSGNSNRDPVQVNIFDARTEITDHQGYAIVWHGDGDKSARLSSKRKKNVKVTHTEYVQLLAIMDAFNVALLTEG